MMKKMWSIALLALVATPALADRPDHRDHDRESHRHHESCSHGHTASSHPRAGVVRIDNRFDGPAEIFVDGRFHGVLRAHGSMTLQVDPGRTRVEARRHTGYLMTAADFVVRPNQSLYMTVEAPMTALKVSNTGSAPLRVEAGGTSTWVVGGTTARLWVPAGNVALKASVRTRHGDQLVEQQSLWVEPGQVSQARVRHELEAPATLTIRNHSPNKVRVVVGGKDRGTLGPLQSVTLNVRSGSVPVFITEIGGRVVFNAAVRTERGDASKLVLSTSYSGTTVALAR